MNPFDENEKPQPPDPNLPLPQSPSGEPQSAESADSPESLDQLSSRIVVHPAEVHPAEVRPTEAPPVPVPGDPLASFSSVPPRPPSKFAFLPEDLRITWSWAHLLFFTLFAFGSILLIEVALVVYYQAGRHLNQKEMEQLFQSKPGVAVGSNVLWFFCIFLFLYVTLAVLPGLPFWRTLGWKKLGVAPHVPTSPWAYFAGGIGLALLVAIVSSRIKTPDHIPIQDLLKSRTGALLLMAMAVLVAPLVEETVFRGYLYPLFASSFSRVAKYFGADPVAAVQTGTSLGIVLTGTLFGFLHGAQLGWTWTLVGMLSTVGIIFTFARARAGTVLASFLLHLGYNSMIAFSAIVSTKGFTQMPPHP